MGCSATAHDKKGNDQNPREIERNHFFRLSKTFRRVNGKLGVRKMADASTGDSGKFNRTPSPES
jgi:hypothetical protein